MTTNTTVVNPGSMLYGRRCPCCVYGDGHQSVPSEPAFLFTAASRDSCVVFHHGSDSITIAAYMPGFLGDVIAVLSLTVHKSCLLDHFGCLCRVIPAVLLCSAFIQTGV
ncbi:hypothetical protein ABIE27_005768 [Paenibacillus sp. 4624]|uniref:Uncharacterized protein n=1 Tax=Paenibacillus amylolyticus TaxID=1451 RepID=A0A5M9WZR0_PAEAM|nr:hypothetical protein [Paenibacillus amylolyticus]KAA8787170.1 hypothetical protein EC604_25390 [Paenibacillus amylolyticus]